MILLSSPKCAELPGSDHCEGVEPWQMLVSIMLVTVVLQLHVTLCRLGEAYHGTMELHCPGPREASRRSHGRAVRDHGDRKYLDFQTDFYRKTLKIRSRLTVQLRSSQS